MDNTDDRHETQDIHPFRVDIPQHQLDDLAERLARARWPDELPDGGWDYGVPAGYLRELAEHWRDRYDWRAQERWLNEFPQFRTTIDGARVHFVHLRSPEPGAVPLLLTHGWPGSFVEFLELVRPLADPRAHGGDPADAFHVVVPSIPGFAFSGPTTERGWGSDRVAEAWPELMRRLGYDRFCAHGGDWGAIISRELGVRYPERVLGLHLTMLPSAVPRAEPVEELEPAEREAWDATLRKAGEFATEHLGYAAIQSTRPQTLSYGLSDSPIGQLAWLMEIFARWTDQAGPGAQAVHRDRLLTNAMLYWLTGTAASSARIYAEPGGAWGGPPAVSTVPTGVAVFPKDTATPLRRLAERTDNIVHWSEFDRGGHFPGLEQPEVLLADLRAFFRKVR